MRIESISVHNFGSFTDAEVDLSAVNAAVVTGQNGAGKSTLFIDAVRWCLFGKCRSDTDGMIRLGATAMTVTVTFCLNPHRYRVMRKRSVITKAGKSELSFMVKSENGWNPISGARLQETQEKIVQLLNCDDDLLTATSFFLQGQADRFSKASPTERKTILAGILRLDRYAMLKSAASREALKIEARLPDRQQAIAALDQASLDLAVVQLANATAQMDERGQRITMARREQERACLLQTRADHQAQLDGMQRLGRDVVANREKIPTLRERERELNSRHARMTLTLANRGTIETDRQESVRLTQQAADRWTEREAGLRKQMALQEQLNGMTELTQQCEANRKRMPSLQARELTLGERRERWEKILKNKPLITEKVAAHQDTTSTIASIDAAMAEREPILRGIEQEIDQAQQKQAELLPIENAITLTDREIADAIRQYRQRTQEILTALDLDRGQITLLGQVPCDRGLQARCQFTIKAIEAQQRIPDQEAVLGARAVDDPDITGLVASAKAAEREALMATAAVLQNEHWDDQLQKGRLHRQQILDAQQESRTALDTAKATLKALERYTILLPELELAEREIDGIRNALTGVILERTELDMLVKAQEVSLLGADALVGEITTIQKALLQNDADRHLIATTINSLTLAIGQATEALQQAERDLPMVAGELASAIFDRTALDDTLKTQELELLTADHTRTQMSQATDLLNAIEYQVKEGQAAHLAITSRIGGMTQQIKTAKREIESGRELREEMARLEQDIRKYRILVDAYAIIPTLVMENALPILEQEANALLGKISTSGMKIKIDTQRALKSRDGLAETLDIAVRDIVGERPYEAYSGGERARIDLSLRLGLSKLLAHRAGATIETIVLDESFAAVDQDGVASLVECLPMLSREFPLILLMTHDENFKHSLSQQIVVHKNEGGSTVEVLA